jgi:hypothetical protein
MKIVIDTSSLLSLVRYYLPFDRDSKLIQTIQTQVESGKIIILDKVAEESMYLAGGIILEALPFLCNKKNQTKTSELFPNKSFFNMLENQFMNAAIRRKLSDIEFESRKSIFLESADSKILLYAINQKKLSSEIVVVTEETPNNNDNKAFKKIPSICQILEIECIHLPNLIQSLDNIDVSF